MSCAGHNSGYREVLRPVLEITVDVRKSYVLCWKLQWISGGLVSCAGNNSGHQEVLCPLLEITVDIRRSYVLCWQLLWISGDLVSFAGNNMAYHEDMCPLLKMQQLNAQHNSYLPLHILTHVLPQSPSHPSELAWGGGGLPQLRHSRFLRNPFHFSIHESHNISTLQ